MACDHLIHSPHGHEGAVARVPWKTARPLPYASPASVSSKTSIADSEDKRAIEWSGGV